MRRSRSRGPGRRGQKQTSTIRVPGEIRRLLATQSDVDAYRSLCRLVADNPREVIGLIGAGVSRPLGYPTWGELLKEIHEKAVVVARSQDRETRERVAAARKIDDAPVRAGIYESVLGRRKLRTQLAKSFKPKGFRKKGAELPTAVVRLPFRYMFTTNYEASLEQRYERLSRGRCRVEVVNWSVSRDVDRLLRKWGQPGGRWIVHLHGSQEKPESMILTEKDYVQRYVRSDVTMRTLLALLAFRSLVCLGFSLEDVDLMQVLRQVKGIRGGDASHFAFLGVSENKLSQARRERIQFADKYGVQPIFYALRAKRSHKALVPILEHLQRVIADAQSERLRLPVGRSASERLRSQIESALGDPLIADDPNKGVFGGLAQSQGRKLTARLVGADKKHPGAWKVALEVAPTDGRPLQGTVTFFLHPTFPKRLQQTKRRVSGGRARAFFFAYGAFTVGAIVDQEDLTLELDLAELKEAPTEFRRG